MPDRSDTPIALTRHTVDTITDPILTALYDEREQFLAAVARVRALHQPMSRAGFMICARCSGWDGRRCLGVVTDYPCDTIAALNEPKEPTT